MPKEIYSVEIIRPAGVSVSWLRSYIKEAVDSWGGQYEPEHPLFYNKPCVVKRIAYAGVATEKEKSK